MKLTRRINGNLGEDCIAMNVKRLVLSAGVLALGVASLTVATKAQGPLYDRVLVNLPYTITIGDKVLQPGDYTIRQLPSPGGASRVLLIYSDNGMKFETSAMTIPALDNRTPEDTRVVLHHFGSDYYFDKIWIQGKDYGYEFPLPDSVKARERERLQPINVAANYQATSESTTDTTTTANSTTTTANRTTTTGNRTTTTASNTTTTNSTTPAYNSTTTQSQTTAPETTTAPATTTYNNNTTVAQNTTPAPMQNQTTTSNYTTGSANRTMPSTSANWLMMLMSGGMLSGAGLALRRFRQ